MANRIRFFTVVHMSALVLLLMTACGYRELKIPISPTFHSIENTIIQPKCMECHTSLATHSGLLEIVKPGNSEESPFYKQLNEGSMPMHSTKLSDAEIKAVADWINNGAPND